MVWNRQRPAIERGAELLAALSLSGGVAFAIFHAAPLAGLALVGAMSLGGIAAAAGALALLARVDGNRENAQLLSFEPGGFAGGTAADKVEDELLLDDPIMPIEPESRVIQLFEPHQPEPLPEPGELVARIADYLDSGRGAPQQTAPSDPIRHDASAALHAALADIRRSLR